MSFSPRSWRTPGRDDIVYVERRGDEYDWRIMPAVGRGDTLHAEIGRRRRRDVVLGRLTS
jgi:hypothetical protein